MSESPNFTSEQTARAYARERTGAAGFPTNETSAIVNALLSITDVLHSISDRLRDIEESLQ